MHSGDLSVLLKKIALSAVIAAVPLFILVGGLWLTRVVLDHPRSHALPTLTNPKR
jgi:hypothetical protein